MIEDYIENMQIILNIKYLNNLINGCSKLNINCENIKKKLINLDDKIKENYLLSDQKNKIVSEVTETETTDYLYLKSWSKLTQIHRIIKIKEFVNNLDISNQNDKEELKEKLIDQIKEKKSKNKVNYDETKGKILSVNNLSFENNKYILL
jgi:hypothetical protein